MATAVLLPLRGLLASDQMTLLYIPVIGLVARLAGTGPSAAGAIAAFFAVFFFFVPPYDTLRVAAPRDWLTLLVFVGVALISGRQTALMRQRERLATLRERDLALLNRLSSRLVSAESASELAAFVASEVVDVLGAARCAVFATGAAGAVLLADRGVDAAGVGEQALADWVVRNDKAVGLGDVDSLPVDERPIGVGPAEAVDGVIADGIYLPLQVSEGLEGVLYARPLAGHMVFPAHKMRLLVAAGNLTAAFLERVHLVQRAAGAAALRETDRLKSTLISSVSHELKTPLAAVTARITGLLEQDSLTDTRRVRDELEAVEADLGRLDEAIGDLLDLSRLEGDAWRPRPDVYGLAEILGSAIARIPGDQRARVSFDVPDGLPGVLVDFGQLARAFYSLIENALAYSPAGTPVSVSARTLGADVIVCVEDEGPGVSDDEKGKVFGKFYRGVAASLVPSGTGLGLAIAREIVRGNGGRIWVEDVRPHGARFAVSFPDSDATGA